MTTKNKRYPVKEDLILIQELVKDGRKSISDLARLTGLSYTTIRERLNRLMERKLLEIKPLVNSKLVGNTAALVRVKTRNPKKLIDRLCLCNRVLSIIVSNSNNEVLVAIVGKDKLEIIIIVERLIAREEWVEEFQIEYGMLPSDTMIPLRNPYSLCGSCVYRSMYKCSGCLPPLRIRSRS
ncbi:MAG: AsnC family transcriptional regulator [Desulfurococcales archaeon]|nr:AsnC family transcriptional regulator [Desulfurococcales archaeon]